MNGAKGKHKRCSDQLWVGGVPTLPTEIVWALAGDDVVRVRSRQQLKSPQEVVVAPRGAAVLASMFRGGRLPDGAWNGTADCDGARGGTARRRRGELAAKTVRAHPHLGPRLRSKTAKARDLTAVVLRDSVAAREVCGLAQAVRERGGRALLVGGSVRDAVRGGHTSKDLDIEVFGMAPQDLAGLVERRFSHVDMTGAAFAVLKASHQGLDLDISVPRTENNTGAGHRGFEVHADPGLSFADAASRRDFTINAMSLDPLTGELIDPFSGQTDLRDGVLRHVGPAFAEDPLRVLRAARFAARFDLVVAPETKVLCRSLRSQAHTLPAERVWGELTMTLNQAATPGVSLHVLDDLDWIGIHPELAELRGIAQDPRWHPEGDVFIHTAHVIDYWAKNLRTGDADDDLAVAIACLAHDFGKAPTTEFTDGRWRAHGHEAAGVELADTWLRRLGQVRLAGVVTPLVANHLAPVQLYAQGRSRRSVRRLATKVPRLDLLARVAEADQGGRPPLVVGDFEAGRWLLETAAELGVTRGPEKRLGSGDQLIALGLKPGPLFRELLDSCYEAQLDGAVTTPDEAHGFLRREASERGYL